ncbi:hypothetical protein H0H87_005611 [Tephrocybe sp. NHM501043]|nr:hypothetical protein H0H87_005611 [Tephrocybe sp. NHM501043]
MASSSFFERPATPATKLGIYRQLSLSAGVHVSPLELGAMSIGDKWSDVLGSMDRESSFKLFDAYLNAGGNFIDTANNYQDESSERFIGEWTAERGIRDQLFIATKYTTNYKRGNNSIAQKPHYTGNNVKAMHISVRESLAKLRTDYIDLFYVHWWDWETSIEEIMRGLHALVMAGKVLYLVGHSWIYILLSHPIDALIQGISDTSAWVVSEANQYARDHALTPFSIYQGVWNVMDRDFERDIIPMAHAEGMALAPWNVLAGGKFRTDAQEEARRTSGEGGVAIAYLLQKTPYVFPIISGRKVEHLLGNVEALDISLTPEQISYLESVVDFNIGFPGNFGVGNTQPALMSTAANFAPPLLLQAHRPAQDK